MSFLVASAIDEVLVALVLIYTFGRPNVRPRDKRVGTVEDVKVNEWRLCYTRATAYVLKRK